MLTHARFTQFGAGQTSVSTALQGRIARLLVTATIGSIVLASGRPMGVRACDLPREADIPAEQAFIVHDGERETIVAAFEVDTYGDRPAVLLPVPGTPDVRGLTDYALFYY